MRRTIAILAAGTLVAAGLTPTGAQARPGSDEHTTGAATSAPTIGLAKVKPSAAKQPAGPNPFLALLPDPAKADYVGWKNWLAKQGDQRAGLRAQQRAVAAAPVLADEEEPAGIRGGNDTPATAQRITGFGTAGKDNPRLRILGTLSPEQVDATEIAPNPEDDGAIPLAGETGVGAAEQAVTTTAAIGDGPHGSTGSGSGDFDFYEVTGTAGQTLTVDIDTPAGELDSVVLLYDAEGELIALNDDSPEGLDSLLVHQFAADGTYYVAVVGFPTIPEDPFDSASGAGAGSEGPYQVTIGTAEQDSDFFAVKLRPGDVLGASVEGSAAKITVYDPDGHEVHGSDQDGSSLYPPNSPLPGGGNAVTEHVADEAGWHYVGVNLGDGMYDITVEAYRPGQQPRQTLFLDFDGARINTAIFGGPGVRTLSPMRSFLGRWGLTAADEDAVIDAIVAEVRENLRHDMIESGLNQRFDIRILNSRDHADPFGQANVSRIIIGGSIEESGVPTIGVAQFIDPGNFGTQDSALVLLDVLSDPAGDDASLNTYLSGASDRIGFVGQAVGNVTAHEAGHFFGDWHVDQFNDHANLMDQGGNFPLMFGVGPDGVGGTADDPDVDFGEDTFNPGEGFTGTEDTLSRIVFGVTR
ncbi:PPC domain-containing protein [Plantactinospora sp. KLBMP9567]|uniref:PPC domain-containing protein n=1 Tax=Plantactinospora sp. KLBMP9567 TaxID=3085900 RepID=UPI0029813A1E|nr:PPC domain-containing protein [Plantactinospora sp. KLBMP9567]MDW5328463.1 PPC domain-containing protein [Plantactinospora sp. KLBMP9567]